MTMQPGDYCALSEQKEADLGLISQKYLKEKARTIYV